MATLTFKPTYKDRLFYDKYTHALSFKLTHVQLCRRWDHRHLNAAIEYSNANGGYSRRSSSIDEQDASNLHNFVDTVAKLDDHKIILTWNHAYVYTNNTQDLQDLAELPYVHNLCPTQAVVNRPRDTVLLTDPQHRYRTFLKERYMTPDTMSILSKFLLSRNDCFRITTDLQRKLAKSNELWTCSYYFVDHNNLEDLVMLQLVCPGIVRKTLTIQAK